MINSIKNENKSQSIIYNADSLSLGEDLNNNDNYRTPEDKPSLDGYIIARSNVIQRLLELGLTPLPVAPINHNRKYKKSDSLVFTGKNPSYLGAQGKPELVHHKEYQDKQPTQSELNKWFVNPKNGIGVLVSEPYNCLDIDAKHFNSVENCKTEVEAWLDKNPQLKQTWIERTHSGGYRLVIKCKNKPSFTNFSLDGIGGKQHGEALGQGRFAVLAPTIGVSGNPYECLNKGEIAEVDSLESIGIYPVKAQEKKVSVNRVTNSLPILDIEPSEPVEIKYRIPLEKFIKIEFQKYLKSSVVVPDRSDSLVAFINECKGSLNWLTKHNIGAEEDIKITALRAATNLGIADRFEKIWNSIPHRNAHPGIWYRKGDEGCWQKLKFVARETFEAVCPQDIKEKLETKKAEKIEEYTFGDGTKIKLNKPISIEKLNLWKDSKTLTHDVAIDSDSFYFPDGYFLNKGFSHFIASGLGTRKTGAAISMGLEGIHTHGLKVVSIAPRLTLLENVAGRTLETWQEKYPGKTLPNIKIVNGNTKQDELDNLDCVDNIVTTLESLPRIAGKISNYVLIVDELNTIVSQALANTSASKKYKMFEAFKLVCNESHSNYIFDANLNNRVVNFASSFCDKPKVVIKNIRKTTNCKITHLVAGEHDAEGNFIAKADSKSAVLDAIRRGNRVYFCSDTRKFIEKLEVVLRKEGKKTLALTSATTSQTWHEWVNEPNQPQGLKDDFLKAFPHLDTGTSWARELTNNPKVFFNKYGGFIDVFLQSPSGNTGLSVDVFLNKPAWQSEDDKYPFDVVLSYYCGVNDIEGNSQSLMRNRDLSIERLLFVPEKSVIPVKKYDNEQEIEEIKRTVFDICIQEGSDILSSHEYVESAVYDQITQYPWHKYCVESQWLESIEKENYWVLLRYFLEQLGMEVNEETICTNEEDKENLKLAKEEIEKIEAELTHSALVFRDDEPKELKEKNDRLTRARRRKTGIDKEYSELIESDFWTVNNVLEFFIKKSDTINTVRRYFNYKYPDISKKRNDWYLYKSLVSGYPSEKLFVKEETAKLSILKWCKFDGLVTSVLNNEGYNLETEIVKTFLGEVKKLNQAKKKIINAPTGKDWENNSKVSSFITSCLAFIGIPVKSQGKKKNSLKVLDADKFNHPFYQYLLSSVDKNYQDFMKEGYFVTKDAIEYWKKTGQVLQGFENFPTSLSGNDLIVELSNEKPKQSNNKFEDSKLIKLIEDLTGTRNDYEGLKTFIYLGVKNNETELLLEASNRVDDELQKTIKNLIEVVKIEIANDNVYYNEILNDLLEGWKNKEFLKGWCMDISSKEWEYITNKMTPNQKQEIEQLREEVEVEFVSKKVKKLLEKNKKVSLYWEKLTLPIQHLVKQNLSEEEVQKLAAAI